ncbi:MAG: hypothetical protein R3F46_12890 [bacterium]
MRNMLQVNASRLPAGDNSCYIRYRLTEAIDAHLPMLFRDAVTMLTPLAESTGCDTHLIEASCPGHYTASSFQGSRELEVYFESQPGFLQELIDDFDARIEDCGLGSVVHRKRMELVRAG